MAYCPIHGYLGEGGTCTDCVRDRERAEEAAEERAARAVYEINNPGSIECPYCLLKSLIYGARRCPKCQHDIEGEYWNAVDARRKALREQQERENEERSAKAAAEAAEAIRRQAAAVAEDLELSEALATGCLILTTVVCVALAITMSIQFEPGFKIPICMLTVFGPLWVLNAVPFLYFKDKGFTARAVWLWLLSLALAVTTILGCGVYLYGAVPSDPPVGATSMLPPRDNTGSHRSPQADFDGTQQAWSSAAPLLRGLGGSWWCLSGGSGAPAPVGGAGRRTRNCIG